MRLSSKPAFPWNDLVLTTFLGVTASFFALSSMVTLASYLGPQDCVINFSGDVTGGTDDRVVVAVLGTVFGSISVFCACQIRDRVLEWRRPRAESPGRVLLR